MKIKSIMLFVILLTIPAYAQLDPISITDVEYRKVDDKVEVWKKTNIIDGTELNSEKAMLNSIKDLTEQQLILIEQYLMLADMTHKEYTEVIQERIDKINDDLKQLK